ncbi:LysR substrate-binding domain-containing protein [Propionivibrio limicola]|uniref:LysR substrate-binding domain-containing protein n=1 Tax=Propionivibrio limicola TaxID=167645 RepID=UPI0012918F18|nr:LysR substrate-binding domain-containing protein [Propionivibrio limicola]
MNNHWDLVDLRIFCEVVQRGSFVGASTQLGISAAYVTKRIASFERILGTKLFHRTTRRVSISEAGEKAYVWAKQVLDAANSLDDCMAMPQGSPSGQLRVTSSPRLGRKHLAPIFASMRKQYPLLNIWFESVYRRVDLLAEGIDIDIRMEEAREPHLISHRIMKSDRVLCATPDYLDKKGRPRTLSDLTEHDCLLYRDFHQTFGVWQMNGPNGPKSVRVSGPMGSNQSDTVWNWTLAGLGISLFSSWDVAKDLKSGKVERVLPDYVQPADIFAITAARTENSTRLQLCLSFIAEQLRTGPYALDTQI